MILKFQVVFFSLYFFLSLSKIEAQTQDLDTISAWEMLAYDGASAFGGLKHAYSRPFHWKKNDFFIKCRKKIF